MSAVPLLQDPRDRQIAALAALVQLERRVRTASSLDSLGFLMVNDTHSMVGYRQGLLWEAGTHRLLAVSGLAMPERDAPFTGWIETLCRHVESGPRGSTPHVLAATDLPDALRADWAEYLPRSLLWLPLRKDGFPAPGALLLARDDAWSEPEVALMDTLQDAYAHAWRALAGPAGRSRNWRRWRPTRRQAAIAVAALLLLSALPVRQSVLAPAEIVARDPAIVRAPLPGVIAEVLVRPNETVRQNQVLLRLDQRELVNKREAASQALGVADAELRQMRQQAVGDDRSKAALAILAGRRDQQAAELAYTEELLQRAELTAPRDGTAIFDDVTDLIGRPIVLGERVMMIADPADAELEIRLPVADAIALEPGAEVRLFLNSDPAAPMDAVLSRTGYRAQAGPDGQLSYRLKARFADSDPRRRVGLKGTAKIYGQPTSLFFYLLRRPLAALRVHLGI